MGTQAPSGQFLPARPFLGIQHLLGAWPSCLPISGIFYCPSLPFAAFICVVFWAFQEALFSPFCLSCLFSVGIIR